MFLPSILLCLLAFVLHKTESASSGTISDRDLILRLFNSLRGLESKLQRHEYRESHADQTMMKVMNEVNNRVSASQKLIGGLDMKLNKLETDAKKKDVKQREMLESLTLLASQVTRMKDGNNAKSCVDANKKVTKEITKKVTKKINELKINVTDGFDHLSQQVNTMESKVSGDILNLINSDKSDDAEKLQQIEEKLVGLKNTMGDTKQMLQTMKDEFESNGKGNVNDIIEGISETMKDQTLMISELKESSGKPTNGGDCSGSLEKLDEIHKSVESLNNSTLAKMIQVREEGKIAEEKMQKTVSQGQSILKDKLNFMTDFTESMFKEVNGNMEKLDSKLGVVGKLEEVVLDSADLSLSTKKRLEYGIQQILMELGDALVVEGTTVKDSLAAKMNRMTAEILSNQTGTLLNVTQGIQKEVENVWRQIGNMHTSLTDSKSTLENVENQTRQYVDTSLSKVSSMDGQVGQVLTRMYDVESNLNSLLGRLSLVMSEFGQVKGALGEEFDSIQDEFQTVYQQIRGEEDPPRDTANPGKVTISDQELEHMQQDLESQTSTPPPSEDTITEDETDGKGSRPVFDD